MKIRELEKEKFIITKELYEEAFNEDSNKFVEFYYNFIQMKDINYRIFVIEEDNEVVSMIHLHPYKFNYLDKIISTYYIVAVATKISHRKRGLYSKLLHFVFEKLKEEKCPFVFLMPASEKIYEPYEFIKLIEFNSNIVKSRESSIIFEEVDNIDDNLYSEKLKEYIYLNNDFAYKTYQNMCLAALDGAYYIAKKNDKILGYIRYVGEDKSLLDVISDKEVEEEIISSFANYMELDEIRIDLCKGKYKKSDKLNKYMYRIIDIESFINILIPGNKDFNINIRISDKDIANNSITCNIIVDNNNFVISKADKYSKSMNIGDFLVYIIQNSQIPKPYIHEVV